jgi:hypothetical protein
MSTTEARDYSYREFCEHARLPNQVQLLTGIAQTALALPDSPGDPGYLRTPPWALAAMAKASICHGNRYRETQVRPNDIPFGRHMYNNLKPEELTDPTLNPLFNIIVRVAYEQFPYQESGYEELARVEAFFGDYTGRKQLEVLDEAGVTALLGAPVRQAVGVAMMLHASAERHAGFFDPAWMDEPNFADVLAVVPREHVEAVIDAVFATDFEGFKQLAESAPQLPSLDRYRFNPLTARPLVRLADGRLLAPIPQLISRRLSPIELYYGGLKRWGEAFTRDLGELLEDYTGRQLRTLPDATVYSEIEYRDGKNTVKSIDWIVVFKDMVLLVEAKATRLTAPARAGYENAQQVFVKTLSDAFEQIDRTHLAIRNGTAEFHKIPAGLPVVGLVATLDPWYMANSTAARTFLHTPLVPTLVVSMRELESLVAIGQRRSAAEILQQIVGDAELRTWMLGSALNQFAEPQHENPILDAAWRRYPFGDDQAGQDDTA